MQPFKTHVNKNWPAVLSSVCALLERQLAMFLCGWANRGQPSLSSFSGSHSNCLLVGCRLIWGQWRGPPLQQSNFTYDDDYDLKHAVNIVCMHCMLRCEGATVHCFGCSHIHFSMHCLQLIHHHMESISESALRFVHFKPIVWFSSDVHCKSKSAPGSLCVHTFATMSCY